MKTITHRHRVDRKDDPRCYTGSVAGRYGIENRAAHGNIRVREYCLCGAYRDTNRNGWHLEYGPWIRRDAR